MAMCFPTGIAHLKRIEALVDDPDCDLPALIIAECQDLLAQIAEKTARIDVKTKRLKALAARDRYGAATADDAGVGPLTALAVEAFAPDMAQFKCGRDFAAWLGLVPRQHSSGGKERLGRDIEGWPGRYPAAADHRRNVAAELAGTARRFSEDRGSRGCWHESRGCSVAIALANKMARQIWAMLTKNEDYRDPALAAAA